MPKRREPTKILVRGPDGTLWLLSEHEVPIKLSPEQNKKVEKVIDECDNKLSTEVVDFGVHACVGVHLGLSTVFVQDRGRPREGQKP